MSGSCNGDAMELIVCMAKSCMHGQEVRIYYVEMHECRAKRCIEMHILREGNVEDACAIGARMPEKHKVSKG